MLIVNTIVKPSSVYGFGCFALEDIQEHRRVWIYNKTEIYRNLHNTNTLQEYEAFGFFDIDYRLWIIPKDNGRYIKCVEGIDFANIVSDNLGEMRARRNIRAGEEILEYYEDYLIEDDTVRYKSAKKKQDEFLQKKMEAEEKAVPIVW